MSCFVHIELELVTLLFESSRWWVLLALDRVLLCWSIFCLQLAVRVINLSMPFLDLPGGLLIRWLWRYYFLSVSQKELLLVDLLLDEQISIHSWCPLSIGIKIAHNWLVFELVPQELPVDLLINGLVIRRSFLFGFDDCLYPVRLVQLFNLLLLCLLLFSQTITSWHILAVKFVVWFPGFVLDLRQLLLKKSLIEVYEVGDGLLSGNDLLSSYARWRNRVESAQIHRPTLRSLDLGQRIFHLVNIDVWDQTAVLRSIKTDSRGFAIMLLFPIIFRSPHPFYNLDVLSVSLWREL